MMHASTHSVAQNSTCERDQLSRGGALLTRLVPQKGAHAMYAALEPDLRGELLAIVPHLRAFGVVLTGDRERADDLVQKTLTTAWGEVHDLEVGTNLRVWLFKVLRQLFYAECTSRINGPDHSADRLSTMTDTGSREAVERFKATLAWIPIEQREALLLMEWEDFSYEETAEICRCSVDTVQSRLNAARRCCSAPN
jgi:RNA polymerase sigma-70 factor, ECF subfamily